MLCCQARNLPFQVSVLFLQLIIFRAQLLDIDTCWSTQIRLDVVNRVARPIGLLIETHEYARELCDDAVLLQVLAELLLLRICSLKAHAWTANWQVGMLR